MHEKRRRELGCGEILFPTGIDQLNSRVQERAYITQNFDSVLNIMDATTEQQLPGCNGLLGSGDESALVNPMLQPVDVYCCIFHCISGWFALVGKGQMGHGEWVTYWL